MRICISDGIRNGPPTIFYSCGVRYLTVDVVAVANSRLQSTMIMSDDNDNNHHGGWNIEFHSLPSHTNDDDEHDDHKRCTEDEGIILTSISLSALFANDVNAYHAFTGATTNGRAENNENENENERDVHVKVRAAKVALADYTARTLSNLLPINTSSSIKVQTMSQAKHSHSTNNNTNRSKLQRGRNNNKRLLLSTKKKDEIPYV